MYIVYTHLITYIYILCVDTSVLAAVTVALCERKSWPQNFTAQYRIAIAAIYFAIRIIH